MFSLCKNVYLVPDFFYENKRERMVFSKEHVGFLELENPTDVTEPSFPDYIKENDPSRFLNTLLSKSNSSTPYMVYADKDSFKYILALWLKTNFPNHTLDDFREVVKLIVDNERLIHVDVRLKEDWVHEVNAEDYIAHLRDDYFTDLESVYEYTKNLNIRETIQKEFKREIGIEWALILRQQNKLPQDLMAHYEERITTMLKKQYCRTVISEARFKLKQALPRIHHLDIGLEYKPSNNGMTSLKEHDVIGLLLDDKVPESKILKKLSDKHFIEIVERIVCYGDSGKSNLNGSHFSHNGFTFESVIETVKNTMINGLFHERFAYWWNINHMVVGAFTDIVKGKPTQYKLDFIKG